MPSVRSTDEAHAVLATDDPRLYQVATSAAGPAGSLPLDDEMLRHWPSGDLFGLSQNAGMGWDPQALAGPQFLLLSTQGGVRAEDGTPVALGYHTGHWEVGLLVREAAREFKEAGGGAVCRVLFRSVRRAHAGHGRHVRQPALSQRCGDRVSPADSLAADAARRAGRGHLRQGVAGHDAGPGRHARFAVRAGSRRRDAAADASAKTPARSNRSVPAMPTARSRWTKRPRLGCHACASPGGGCQFLGTAATSQVVGEALGLSLPHCALAPSGQPIWLDMARRSARALWDLHERKIPLSDILTDAALRNAMVVHAAFGGSTNLLLHIPAIAHQAGLRRPTVDDWERSQPPGAAIRRRAAQRAGGASDRAGVPGRRRAGGDAPSARPGPARSRRADRERLQAGRRARLVAGLRAAAGAARSICASATASIRTT